MRAVVQFAVAVATSLLFLIYPALANSFASLPCNAATAFVLNNSVVVVFNSDSSANCTFPMFPYLDPHPLSGSNNSFAVTMIAIGGGGGGGCNGGGGGGAGGLLVRTEIISSGQSVSIVVGSGGAGASQSLINAISGSSTVISISGTSFVASGGGFGGSRNGEGSLQANGVSGGSGGGGGGGQSSDTSGGAGTQGSAGGVGYQQGGDALCSSSGAGGGGFSQPGGSSSSCLAGNGGNGYQLPFAPTMSSWVAGGGAGSLTCYTTCPNPQVGTNGLGQNSYGGGGQGGCGSGNAQPIPPTCYPLSGSAGAVFLNFSFICAAGSRQVVQSGFFTGYPCELCPPGNFSSAGSATCELCPAGKFNNVSGASSCMPCPAGTYNPNKGSASPSACETCPPGYFSLAGSTSCAPCPAGSYNPDKGSSSPSACETCPPGYFSSAEGSAYCEPCHAGSYNPNKGSSSSSACEPCAPGTFSSAEGNAYCAPCPAGKFNNASSSTACIACTSGTYSATPGASSCSKCSPGMFCVFGASQQCRCPINSYQPSTGASDCRPCLGQAVPATGQSKCVTEVAATDIEITTYKAIIGIFATISLGSVWLVVILVRSRHAFSVRPFHSGICIYIASFAPFALLKSIAVSRLLEAGTQQEQLVAGLIMNASFMVFFWLGFGGKMALIQLWMHLISRHSSGTSEHALMHSARRTWKLMRITVVGVCVLYSAGFITLVGFFSHASNECAAAADSSVCIPSSSDSTPSACRRVLAMAHGIFYYEGLFAAVVVVVFMFYALVFNGLVYAMLTSDATFSSLTKFQRMLINSTILRLLLRPYASRTDHVFDMSLTRCFRFIPPSWRPSQFTTTGDLELWRTSLRALGIKLAVISVCSFTCKALLVALAYFDFVQDGSSLGLSLSSLLVEALPSLLTIILLIRYHSSSIVASRDSLLGTSLLVRGSNAQHRMTTNDAGTQGMKAHLDDVGR